MKRSKTETLVSVAGAAVASVVAPSAIIGVLQEKGAARAQQKGALQKIYNGVALTARPFVSASGGLLLGRAQAGALPAFIAGYAGIPFAAAAAAVYGVSKIFRRPVSTQKLFP